MPDLDGRSPIGTGQRATSAPTWVVDDVDGSELVTLQVTELPSHSHMLTGAIIEVYDSPNGSIGVSAGTVNRYTNTATRSTDATGSDAGHPNMHPVYAVKFGIIFDD